MYLRPMFADVHGQNHIIDYIVSSHRENRLAHTILLSGKAGYGLFLLGKAISSYLLCEHRETDSCSECPNCRKVEELQHPDLHIFFPTSKAGQTTAMNMTEFRKLAVQDPYFDFANWLEYLGEANKSLNINKDIVKEINHAFRFKSFESGPRVYLIWGAEYLGKEGNKLLKVIEEPPEDAYIILLTENRKQILPTILSRCQTFLLKPLSGDDMLQALNLEPTEQNILQTQWAQGDIRRAGSDQTSTLSNFHELWLSYFRIAFKAHPVELIEKSTELANGGKEFCRQFLRYGLSLIGQMLKSVMGIPIENERAIEKLAQLLSLEDLDAINERLQEDYVHVNRNANLKLLFASQSVWLSDLFRKKKKSIRRP